jgi:hypothetical protein
LQRQFIPYTAVYLDTAILLETLEVPPPRGAIHPIRSNLVSFEQVREFGPDTLGLEAFFASSDYSAWLCHSHHLAQCLPRILEVRKHLVAKRNVEGPVRKGESVCRILLESDFFHPSRCGNGLGPW